MRSPVGQARSAGSALEASDYGRKLCGSVYLYDFSSSSQLFGTAIEKTDSKIPPCWVFPGKLNVKR